ncbi:MAG: AEC family transporter [Paracoccaceae bacterium]|nr:AEC family transporter [Paracoccaceae bacterium]
MNLVLTVLEIVAPVFLLAAIGFVWVRLGHEYSIRFVTQLTMTLSVPCLIFTALMNTEIDADALAALTLASVAAYVVVGLAALAVTAGLGLSLRTYFAPLTFGNTGNLGLPLALFAFGEAGLDMAVVVFAVMAVFSFTIGVWVVAGGGSLWNVVREPMVAGTLLGALFLWQGWETPRFLTNTLELVGQVAIPLMLITLGVALARLKPARIGRDLGLCIGKAAVTAGLAYGVGLWFGLAPVPLAVLTLQVATPVAVTSYLLAEKYEADAEAVAGLVVVSTLLSVIYLPLLLAFVI